MKKLIITILAFVLCSFSVFAIVGHPANQVFPGLFATGNYTFGTNVLFIDDTNNRVGIGTTSPTHKLNVVGDVNITGTIINTDFTTLTDDSMADNLHRHSELSADDGTPDGALTINNAGQITTGYSFDTAYDDSTSLSPNNLIIANNDASANYASIKFNVALTKTAIGFIGVEDIGGTGTFDTDFFIKLRSGSSTYPEVFRIKSTGAVEIAGDLTVDGNTLLSGSKLFKNGLIDTQTHASDTARFTRKFTLTSITIDPGSDDGAGTPPALTTIMTIDHKLTEARGSGMFFTVEFHLSIQGSATNGRHSSNQLSGFIQVVQTGSVGIREAISSQLTEIGSAIASVDETAPTIPFSDLSLVTTDNGDGTGTTELKIQISDWVDDTSMATIRGTLLGELYELSDINERSDITIS